MIKVFYKSGNSTTYKAKLAITKDAITAQLLEATTNDTGEPTGEYQPTGEDAITLESYNTYTLAAGSFNIRQADRSIKATGCRWYEVNRYTMPSRLDYKDAATKGADLLQVDTGGEDRYITLLRLGKDNLEIDTEEQVEYVDLSTIDTSRPLRYSLWDRYGITIDGTSLTDNVVIKAPQVDGSKEYAEILVEKYKPDYSEKLTGSGDNEALALEATGGVLNCSSCYLSNGRAVVRLYPMGYKGLVKIKLGHRWYPAWCEYIIEVV